MALIERTLLMDGTRVIIADKECAITSGRRHRAERAPSGARPAQPCASAERAA
jgi:TPP-dependent indolepyruvate ferredoxin oxidoreductase alpha subunit